MNDSLTIQAPDTFPLPADTAAEWVELPEVRLDNTGFVGEERAVPFFESDGVTAFFLLALLFGAYLFRAAMEQRRRSLSNRGDTDSARQDTIGGILVKAGVFLMGMMGYGMAMTRLLGDGGWGQAGLRAAGFAVFLTAKRVVLEAYLRTFFPPDRSGFAGKYTLLTALYGIITLLFTFASVYLPGAGPVIAAALTGAGALALSGYLGWLFYRTFFKADHLYVAYILYLCTLELTPLLVLGKLLCETFALTNL